MYIINGFLKIAEKDNFIQGCDPDTAITSEINMTFKAETINEITEKVRSFFGVDNNALILNSCEEDGRIDIQITETAEGDQPLASEMERFKKGEFDLWLATYSGVLQSLSAAKF